MLRRFWLSRLFHSLRHEMVIMRVKTKKRKRSQMSSRSCT